MRTAIRAERRLSRGRALNATLCPSLRSPKKCGRNLISILTTKWLGISPQHQPPNHYRLLGLEAFESDRDVIRSAAERQAAHIQTFKIGPELEWSQRLLNEIAQAKICLLNAAAKAEYDHSLRKSLVPIASMATPPIIAARPVSELNVPRSREPGNLPATDSSQLPASASAWSKMASRQTAKSTWRPLALAFMAGAVVLSTVIFGLRGWIPSASQQQWQDSLATPLPDILHSPRPARDPKPQPAPESSPETTTRPRPQPGAVSPMIPSPSKAVGKQPVPTEDQIAQFLAHNPIDRRRSVDDLFQTANACQDPVMRYALYQTVIDIAVEERKIPIARQAVARLGNAFDVDESAL